MVLPSTQEIGPYRLIEQIGAGGMATVYRAVQPKLERPVALKVMHQAFLQDPHFRARFEREARVVGRLEHPNIVPIYDYDEFNGQPYLVMKLISGKTLKDLLREGPLSLEQIQRTMSQIADALTYAHQQGILHRDIKPSNILIDEGGIPYLTDFGLARITQLGESTMSADMMLGTPHYISPEQAQGLADIDARTDVYSLGVILYELVTGRVPFMGETTYAIVHKHIYAAPPSPSQLNPEIPPQVESVLLKALEKNPADRYETPNAMMAAFEKAVTHSGLTRLDESRVETAAKNSVPEVTPGGGRYVSIPAPVTRPEPLPGEQRLNEFFRQMSDRVQQLAVEAQKTDTWKRIAESMKDRVQVEQNERGVSIQFGKARIESPIAPQERTQEERKRAKTVKVIAQDWGTDEESIRRRIDKRIQDRAGFIGHAVTYIIMAFLFVMLEAPITDGIIQWLQQNVPSNPDLPEQLATPEFAAALQAVPFSVLVLLPWLGGLLGHGLSVFYRSGRRLEARRRALHRTLVTRYGDDWQDVIDAKDYKRVRHEVEERFKGRLGFMTHALSTIFTIITVFVVASSAIDMGNVFAEEPLPQWVNQVPLVVMMFLLFGVLIHGIVLLLGNLANKDAAEKAIQLEMERERRRMSRTLGLDEKAKRTPQKAKMEDLSPRLTEDGEFTDSFISELENEQRRKS